MATEHRGDTTVPFVGVSNEIAGAARSVVQAGVINGGVQVLRTPPDERWQLDAVSTAPPLGRRSAERPLRGRSGLLTELLALLDQPDDAPRTWVLHGLAGCGKTALALEVTHRALLQGTHVWWVSATDRTGLVASLYAVARQAGANPEQLAHDSAPDVLWRCLSTYPGRWLLVIDDANDPDLLGSPPGRQADGTGWIRPWHDERGLVVVTTQEGDPARWGSWCRLRQMKALDRHHATQVLLDHADERAGSADDAAGLADRFGRLPLALRLAGTYLAATTQVPWRDSNAIHTFADYKAALDAGRLGISDDTGQEIGSVWELSIELLERRGIHEGKQLLSLLAIFADAPIPYVVLLDPVTLSKSPLFPGFDGMRLWRSLQALAHVGLLDLTDHEPTAVNTRASAVLRVHPLVRDASLRWTDLDNDPAEYLAIAAALLHAAIDGTQPGETSTWPVWQGIAPHVFHVARKLVTVTGVATAVVEQVTHTAELVADYLRDRGLYERADEELAAVVDICGHMLGNDHPVTLNCRRFRAFLIHDLGDYRLAETEYQSVLEAQRSLLGDEHLDTLHTRNGLAHVRQHLGRYDLAEAEHRAVLRARRRLLGDDHVDTQIARCDLAAALRGLRRFEQAESEYRAVLDFRSRTLGGEHRHTLNARYHLASVLHDLKRYDEAESEYQAVFDVESRVLSDDHPDVLGTRFKLAHMLHHRGQHTAADAALREILETRRRVLGDEHPIVVESQIRPACLEQTAESSNG